MELAHDHGFWNTDTGFMTSSEYGMTDTKAAETVRIASLKDVSIELACARLPPIHRFSGESRSSFVRNLMYRMKLAAVGLSVRPLLTVVLTSSQRSCPS